VANEELTVKVVFQGETAKRFMALKEKYGLENNTDLLRMLVAMTYAREIGGKYAPEKPRP